jgi:hypothetical protein
MLEMIPVMTYFRALTRTAPQGFAAKAVHEWSPMDSFVKYVAQHYPEQHLAALAYMRLTGETDEQDTVR